MFESRTPPAQIVAERPFPSARRPFFTISIPHYLRREYLEGVLKSLFDQDFDDFEILISDDNSPDDSRVAIPLLLGESGRPFRYYLQSSNLRYDRNLRFCLDSARGHYVFLLGNDDTINGPHVLRELAATLEKLGRPQAAYTNFINDGTGVSVRRATATELLPSGPDTALEHYNRFVFVSGIVFDRDVAVGHETDQWDGSTFYQIFLASRIIAAGGTLGMIELCAVRQDYCLGGRPAPNYVDAYKGARWNIKPRTADIDQIIYCAADGFLTHCAGAKRSSSVRRLIAHSLVHSYLFWLFEYRRVANYSYSIGLARGLNPRILISKLPTLQFVDRLRIRGLYLFLTIIGLTLPQSQYKTLIRAARWLRGHRSALD